MSADYPECVSFIPDEATVALYLSDAAEQRDRVRAKASTVWDSEGLWGLTRSHQECTRILNICSVVAAAACAASAPGSAAYSPDVSPASVFALATPSATLISEMTVLVSSWRVTYFRSTQISSSAQFSSLSVTLVSSRRILWRGYLPEYGTLGQAGHGRLAALVRYEPVVSHEE